MATFLFAGGGTGGHLFPALAIAEHIARIDPDSSCAWACSDRAIDAQILRSANVEFTPVPARPFGLRPRQLARFCAAWGPSVRVGRQIIARRRARDAEQQVVCAAMGGFVAAPIAQAARVERAPLVLINLDAVPGKANLWIARRAGFCLSAARSEAIPDAWESVGPIVRADAIASMDRAGCRAHFGLDPDRPTLFVSGGSQGSASINGLMRLICTDRPELLSGWQVIHQYGAQGDRDDLAAVYAKSGVGAYVQPFIERVGLAWGAADLAITRCGAGGVAECWANGVPAVFLPYPYHRDQHQRRNAAHLEAAGAAVIVRDHVEPRSNLEAHARILQSLLSDADRRAAMRRALAGLGAVDGARRVAQHLVQCAQGGSQSKKNSAF